MLQQSIWKPLTCLLSTIKGRSNLRCCLPNGHKLLGNKLFYSDKRRGSMLILKSKLPLQHSIEAALRLKMSVLLWVFQKCFLTLIRLGFLRAAFFVWGGWGWGRGHFDPPLPSYFKKNLSNFNIILHNCYLKYAESEKMLKLSAITWHHWFFCNKVMSKKSKKTRKIFSYLLNDLRKFNEIFRSNKKVTKNKVSSSF